MDIQVIKSKRKTIGLEVHTDGRVILRAPMRITNRELNKFIDNHMSWIESKLSLIEKKNADKISVMDSLNEEEAAVLTKSLNKLEDFFGQWK